MRRIGPQVKGLASELGLEGPMKLDALRERWEEIVGGALAAHLWPRSLSESVLHVSVDSPLWLEHANYYRAEILKKMEPFGIKDIRLKAGPPPKRQPLTKAPGKPEDPQLSAAERALVEGSLIPIRDEEVQASFRRVMEKALSREIRRKA